MEGENCSRDSLWLPLVASQHRRARLHTAGLGGQWPGSRPGAGRAGRAGSSQRQAGRRAHASLLRVSLAKAEAVRMSESGSAVEQCLAYRARIWHGWRNLTADMAGCGGGGGACWDACR